MLFLRLLTILFISAGFAITSKSRALPFLEESKRSAWDRGCPDWPVHIPGHARSSVEKNPAIHIEKSQGIYRVYVKMLVSAERGESFESLYQSLEKLVMDGAPYPQWVLPGINDRAGGGQYFVTVDGLVVGERERNVHFTLTGPYSFQVLWFKRSGTTTIELRKDLKVLPPNCDVFKTSGPVLTAPGTSPLRPLDRVVYRMTPRPEIIELMIGELYFIPDYAQKRVELRMRLVAKPSSLVYRLMPENVMRSELEVRGRRIFENLIDLRRASAVPASSTSVSEIPLKKEARPKKAR